MKKRFAAFLKQGLSPEKLALCVALGCVLGVFPVLGTTTILCAAVAWAAGLNQAAIQSVNYIVYPLQLALLVPFYRFGERLFRVPPQPLALAYAKLWETSLRAIAVWGLVAPFTVLFLYLALLPVFRRLRHSLLIQ